MSTMIDQAHTTSGKRRCILRCTAAALCVILICVSIAPAADKAPGEYEIKAAFLYNFAKFVQWPKEAFPNSNSPLIIGILGDDPFGGTLDQDVAGKFINGRKLEVRRYRELRDLHPCQILFICSSENKYAAKILDTAKNWHALTVGESEGFTRDGGVMNFYIENKKVHFEANLEASRKAGLQISSKLLKLARIVRN